MEKKYLLPVLLFTACHTPERPCPERIIVTDTVVRPRIDTLVIIQTYDSISESTIDKSTGFYIMGGGSELQPDTLFKGGKRIDTIWRTTIIYY